MVGYGLRVITGLIADRTKKYWLITMIGYFVDLIFIQLLFFVPVNGWLLACIFITGEKIGKAIKKPAKDTLVSFASKTIGTGKAFAIGEIIDQLGAFLGPVLVFFLTWLLKENDWFMKYKLIFLALGIPALICFTLLAFAQSKFPNPAGLEVEKLTIIPNLLFAGCTSLASIDLPSGVTTIGASAFSGCSSLNSITFHEGLTTISSQAFSNCSSLPNPTFPSTLTTIGSSAFNRCLSLTQVNIPASVTTMDGSSFGACPLLTAINVDLSNPAYTSNDGVLYDEDLTTLMRYPAGKTTTDYVIPASVTTIINGAISLNDYITTLYIPNTVTTIAYYAIQGCPNLTINAQATEKPAGWDTSWNISSIPVVWGYTI